MLRASLALVRCLGCNHLLRKELVGGGSGTRRNVTAPFLPRGWQNANLPVSVGMLDAEPIYSRFILPLSPRNHKVLSRDTPDGPLSTSDAPVQGRDMLFLRRFVEFIVYDLAVWTESLRRPCDAELLAGPNSPVQFSSLRLRLRLRRCC
jgi:hypothetical protein